VTRIERQGVGEWDLGPIVAAIAEKACRASVRMFAAVFLPTLVPFLTPPFPIWQSPQ
jgi:hypothetical protein